MFTTFLPIATWTNLQGQQFLISVKLSLLIQDLPDVLGIALYTFLSIAIWTDLQRQQFFLLPSITFVDEVNVHIHSYLNWFARAAVLLPSWNNLTFVEEVHVTSYTFRILGKLRCFCFCSQFWGLHFFRVGRQYDIHHSAWRFLCPHLYWAHYIFLGTKYFCNLFDNFID